MRNTVLISAVLALIPLSASFVLDAGEPRIASVDHLQGQREVKIGRGFGGRRSRSARPQGKADTGHGRRRLCGKEVLRPDPTRGVVEGRSPVNKSQERAH